MKPISHEEQFSDTSENTEEKITKMKNIMNENNKDDNSNDELSEPARERVFKCNFCPGEFSTLQGLCGHQNAHKEERALAKIIGAGDLLINAGAFAYPTPYPYYSYLNYPRYNYPPIYGPSSKSPIGVRVESMIKKPLFSRYPLYEDFLGQFGNGNGIKNLGLLSPAPLTNKAIVNEDKTKALLARLGQSEINSDDDNASGFDLDLKL